MFKRIFSYILPFSLFQKESTISGLLSVTLLNGKQILNSPNTDYSYGSLQRVLRFGLHKIGFDLIRSQEKVLVLGLAAGSVVETLVEEVNFQGEIHGVDIDKEVIEIGKQYFHLGEIKNLQIFIENAQDYIKRTHDRYDLVIVDIFQDDRMPNFLFEPLFFNQINNIINKEGIILFNTIVKNKKEFQRNRSFMHILKEEYNILVFSKIELNNELIILTKK